MKTTTLTLAAILTAALGTTQAAESRDGMHRMPDGRWMKNQEMPAAAAASASTTSVPRGDGRTVIATVNGLVCDFCAQSVHKTLMREPGVADARVDLSAKTVTVRLKDGGELPRERLGALLRDAGYDMTAYKVE